MAQDVRALLQQFEDALLEVDDVVVGLFGWELGDLEPVEDAPGVAEVDGVTLLGFLSDGEERLLALWRAETDIEPEDYPVVFISEEGEEVIVAPNFRDFLCRLCFHGDAAANPGLSDEEEFTEGRDNLDEEALEALDTLRGELDLPELRVARFVQRLQDVQEHYGSPGLFD